jgi:hypothetical protein
LNFSRNAVTFLKWGKMRWEAHAARSGQYVCTVMRGESPTLCIIRRRAVGVQPLTKGCSLIKLVGLRVILFVHHTFAACFGSCCHREDNIFVEELHILSGISLQKRTLLIL